MEFKIHLIVITLSIFVSALIGVVEMPNVFEYALAQQQPRDTQQDNSNQNSGKNFIGIQEEERSGVERDSQDLPDRDLDRDRTSEGEEQRNSLDRSSQQIAEDDDRDLDRDRTPEVEE